MFLKFYCDDNAERMNTMRITIMSTRMKTMMKTTMTPMRIIKMTPMRITTTIIDNFRQRTV